MSPFKTVVSRTIDGAKFVAKNLTPLAGALFLFFAGKRINHDGYKKRILIVFGGGIGDVIKSSVICAYLKKYLPDYEPYYLMPYKFKLPYAKEHIFFNYREVKKNPSAYFSLINQLRDIGFSKALVLFPFWEGFLSSLAMDTGADQVFCYKEREPTFFYQIVSGIHYALRYWKIKKKVAFIHVSSGWDKKWPQAGQDPSWPFRTFPSEVGKQVYFLSQVVKSIHADVPLNKEGLLKLENPCTEILVDETIEREYLRKVRDEYRVDLKNCCLIGLGTSGVDKNWQIEKFIEVAKALRARGTEIAIIDHPKDAKLVETFAAGYGNNFFNLGITADLERVFVLIKHSALVFANDTSFIHVAIALRVPSVCVISNQQLGDYSLYGYENINTWVFDETKSKQTVHSVSVVAAIKACFAILDYKKDLGRFQFHYGTDYNYD